MARAMARPARRHGRLGRAIALATVALAVALALAAPAWATPADGGSPGATAAPGDGAEGDDRPRATTPPARPFAPSRRDGATTAAIVAPVMARQAPSFAARPVWRIPTATGWSRQPQVLLVLRSAVDADGRRWLRLKLPIRPNTATGWVPADYVRLRRSAYWVDVSTSRRLVTVRRAGRVVRRFRAVVGRPGTPTPHGLFAIWEKNRQPDPDAFLGPWALPITALSNVLERFGGGPGRVAIHGRSGASLRDPLGSARSHGCVRVDNRHVVWLARTVPAGTPVRIHR